jgi:hypothetical protein
MKIVTRRIAFAAALGIAAAPAAWAVDEVEPNAPIDSPQSLVIEATAGTTGGATIEAVMGVLSGAPVADVDFFEFTGQEGDVVTVDIDGGMGGARSVDTIVGIFGPGPAFPLLRTNDDAGFPLDPGSTHPFDSRVDNFRLPATGSYTVGVSSFPRRFGHGGVTTSTMLNALSNGDYKLLISGVTVAVLQINIDIKPGSGDVAPINPKSRGKIPVALLGAADFDVAAVDVDSLRFGHSGEEPSLSKCGKPEDINGDGRADLVCHFENQDAKFAPSDDEAILKGKLADGRAFEGRGWLKMVPVKAAY